MPLIVDGTTGVTFNDASLQGAAASPFGLKNRIINGDMVVDQRNNGASGTAGAYTVDRWYYGSSQSSRGTWQRNAGSVTPPAGFANYLGFTSSSAYSVTSGDFFAFGQPIEGFNVADLAWGTANARTVTLSFWVRSSLTGLFGGALQNSGASRTYPFSYTISAANTWEQKSITIPGDTTGTWLTNNGTGVTVNFSLGYGTTFSGPAGSWSGNNFGSATGAVSVVGTNGATFYITGVQLERNTTATPFEWIPFGTELALCQRYCLVYGGSKIFERVGTGSSDSTTSIRITSVNPVPMRTTPTMTFSSLGDWQLVLPGIVGVLPTGITLSSDESSPLIVALSCTISSNANFGSSKCAVLCGNGTTNARIIYSAEL
jgi:hypothetical protein